MPASETDCSKDYPIVLASGGHRNPGPNHSVIGINYNFGSQMSMCYFFVKRDMKRSLMGVLGKIFLTPKREHQNGLFSPEFSLCIIMSRTLAAVLVLV